MLILKTNLYANNANNSQNNRKPSNKYGHKSSRLYRAIHRKKEFEFSLYLFMCDTRSNEVQRQLFSFSTICTLHNTFPFNLSKKNARINLLVAFYFSNEKKRSSFKYMIVINILLCLRNSSRHKILVTVKKMKRKKMHEKHR